MHYLVAKVPSQADVFTKDFSVFHHSFIIIYVNCVRERDNDGDNEEANIHLFIYRSTNVYTYGPTYIVISTHIFDAHLLLL